jgi:ATP-binding cassette subfamily F protein 3
MLSVKKLSSSILGEPLFEKVSFVIAKGTHVGLVGQNGTGKSTLLKIIAGVLESSEGSIHLEQERVGYLPQELTFEETATIAAFLALPAQKSITSSLKQVGLDTLSPELLVKQLSGGQKTRLAIAKLLADKPTFLLLDEPTNHLDIEAVEWLETFLTNFAGGVLIVSHDRRLLDNTVSKIFELDSSTRSLNEYEGGYTNYLAEREKRIERQDDAYKRQQREKKRLEEWIALKKQEAAIYDSPSKGKMIRAKERYLEREILEKPVLRPKDHKKIRGMNLEGETANAKLICRVSNVNANYDGKNVLSDVSFEIYGKEKVLLSGMNGSGKTTLLKVLLGVHQPRSGTIKIGERVSIGYFAQEHEHLNMAHTVLEEFHETQSQASEQDARRALGSFLFSEQDVFKKVSSLSMGERVRLVFAKLTHSQYELLILDEPTNHLDIPSREVIEKALLGFQGALLAVSHDRYFVEKMGFDRELHLERGVLDELSIRSENAPHFEEPDVRAGRDKAPATS